MKKYKLICNAIQVIIQVALDLFTNNERDLTQIKRQYFWKSAKVSSNLQS